MNACPQCGAQLEAPATSASRLPPGMGVIWSEQHRQPAVYQLDQHGAVESVRILGAEFVTIDAALRVAVHTDAWKERA